MISLDVSSTDVSLLLVKTQGGEREERRQGRERNELSISHLPIFLPFKHMNICNTILIV